MADPSDSEEKIQDLPGISSCTESDWVMKEWGHIKQTEASLKGFSLEQVGEIKDGSVRGKTQASCQNHV